MIFPCIELFLVIFHDFQSLWEPCMYHAQTPAASTVPRQNGFCLIHKPYEILSRLQNLELPL